MRHFLFLILVGCGTTTFTSTGGDGGTTPTDGGDAGGGGDAAMPKCNPTSPFGAAHPLSEIETQADDVSARIAYDGLGIVFARNTNSNFDIFAGGRTNPKDQFGNIMAVSGVNTAEDEYWPSLVGLELFFTRHTSNSTGIYMATGPGFGNAMPVRPDLVVSATQNYAPYVLPLAQVMYFSQNLAGVVGIMRMERAQGAWGMPSPVTSINMSGSQSFSAAVTPDELRMYFASDRSGSQGIDVWTSARKQGTDAWGTPMRVDVVNTGDDDVPTWVSPDDCLIVLQRRSQGNFDVYYAQRPQ